MMVDERVLRAWITEYVTADHVMSHTVEYSGALDTAVFRFSTSLPMSWYTSNVFDLNIAVGRDLEGNTVCVEAVGAKNIVAVMCVLLSLETSLSE